MAIDRKDRALIPEALERMIADGKALRGMRRRTYVGSNHIRPHGCLISLSRTGGWWDTMSDKVLGMSEEKTYERAQIYERRA